MQEGVASDDSGKLCQRRWIPLPWSYELAPANTEVLQEIVTKHTWSTDVVVLADLKAYVAQRRVSGEEEVLERGRKVTKRIVVEPGKEFGDSQDKAVKQA